MKTQALSLAMLFGAFTAFATDPLTNSWLTTYSGQYARVYTNNAMLTAGTTRTTWSNGTQNQSLPAYAGVQEIYSSSNWVYIRTTGLASHNMGPWLNGAFPNLPINTKTLYRFPHTNSVPTTKTLTGLGAIGYFVDGVAMFDSRDAFYWNGSSEPQGSGYWNRDAYVNEASTFDPAYAHQPQDGMHHYHASPIALRYQLGDHVDYNATTKTYSEATNTVTKHSPLLGWVGDGSPVYGPYGYSIATNSSSGIRRMISGYVLRNGQYGTSNLTADGRATIPNWAVRLYGVASNILAGPTVSSSYPLGRYMEDNDYLGDLGFAQGTDFDLDEYNGRWCVTPEYPAGVYAYFVSISSNGTPTFPYNIGRAYHGNPTAGTVTAISENVVTNFLGNANLTSNLNTPTVNNGAVTLTWSAVEGGTYQVEATTNLNDWTVIATNVLPNQIVGNYTNATSLDSRFYRVARTAIASFDGFTSTSSATTTAPGGNASRGTTVTVAITLPSNPPWPPANAPISSVTLASSISGTNISDSTQGQVLATFAIPANASTGLQNIVIVFNNGPTYTVTFTIN